LASHRIRKNSQEIEKLSRGKKGKKPSEEQQEDPSPGWTEAIDVM